MDARRWMAALMVPVLLAGCDVGDESAGEVAASESPASEQPTEADPEPTAAEAEAEESGEGLPGDYAEIIASETDCGELQAIFDVADNAGEGRREVGDLERAEEFTAVMSAVDERMEEVGCYD